LKRKNLSSYFPFSNINYLIDNYLSLLFKEIKKRISLNNMCLISILQNSCFLPNWLRAGRVAWRRQGQDDRRKPPGSDSSNPTFAAAIDPPVYVLVCTYLDRFGSASVIRSYPGSWWLKAVGHETVHNYLSPAQRLSQANAWPHSAHLLLLQFELFYWMLLPREIVFS